MKPKLIAASIAAAFAVLAAPAHAGPLDAFGGSEVKALAYVSLPFGGLSSSKQAPILGFAIDQTQSARNERIGFPSLAFQQLQSGSVRSLMDVRFNTTKQTWERFRIGGVDALTYSTRMKADGTTETVATLAEVPTWAIVAGVVVGAAVIHDATKKDDPKATAPACPLGTVWTGVACV